MNENLLKNTRFAADTARWVLGTNVTRDPTRTLNGCVAIKSEQGGLASDSWRGVYNSPYIPCLPGDKFTASVWVYIEDYTTFDGLKCVLEVNYHNTSNARVQTGSASFAPTAAHNGKWTRVVLHTTASNENTANCRIYPFVQRNGTAWFACPKLERGSVATPYTSSHWEDWKPPIVDRTESDILNRAPKAYCNVPDLQRMEDNVECLVDVIGSPCARRSGWKMIDFPTVSEFSRIRSNIQTLRDAYYTLSATPPTPENPLNHWQKWNDAERILLDLYTLYNQNLEATNYTGEVFAGESIGVI